MPTLSARYLGHAAPALALVAGMLASACGGGGGGDADPDGGDDRDGGDERDAADPGPASPIFDDSASTVTVIESEWHFVDIAPRSWVSASFSGGTAAFLTETMREGNCRLLASEVSVCQDCSGFCVDGECQPWPVSRDAGRIAITGLSTAVTLSFQIGGYYIVDQGILPTDLFSPDDEVTASTDGAEVDGFTVGSHGVARIAPDLGGDCAGELQLHAGSDAVVTWPDPSPGARVHLWMPSANQGHGLPPNRVVECEGRDTGTLRIPATIADAFPTLAEDTGCEPISCIAVDCPPASLVRYADGRTYGADPVVLRVQSELLFQATRPRSR